MKKVWSLVVVAALVVCAFLVGSWVTWHVSGKAQPAPGRKVLY